MFRISIIKIHRYILKPINSLNELVSLHNSRTHIHIVKIFTVESENWTRIGNADHSWHYGHYPQMMFQCHKKWDINVFHAHISSILREYPEYHILNQTVYRSLSFKRNDYQDRDMFDQRITCAFMIENQLFFFLSNIINFRIFLEWYKLLAFSTVGRRFMDVVIITTPHEVSKMQRVLVLEWDTLDY